VIERGETPHPLTTALILTQYEIASPEGESLLGGNGCDHLGTDVIRGAVPSYEDALACRGIILHVKPYWSLHFLDFALNINAFNDDAFK
jgi:hypothetical protein